MQDTHAKLRNEMFHQGSCVCVSVGWWFVACWLGWLISQFIGRWTKLPQCQWALCVVLRNAGRPDVFLPWRSAAQRQLKETAEC